MRLEGSYHCGAVRFALDSTSPVPYKRSYCSICRKTRDGGYAVNLGGEARTLRVRGCKHVAVYNARLRWPGAARAPARPIVLSAAAAAARCGCTAPSGPSWRARSRR